MRVVHELGLDLFRRQRRARTSPHVRLTKLAYRSVGEFCTHVAGEVPWVLVGVIDAVTNFGRQGEDSLVPYSRLDELAEARPAIEEPHGDTERSAELCSIRRRRAALGL